MGLHRARRPIRPLQPKNTLMAKYSHAYVIPDQGENDQLAGGVLYDRWDNFSWFADVADLDDASQLAIPRTSEVKEHKRSRFMNSKGKISMPRHNRDFISGIIRSKGALPGKTITLQANDDLGGEEIRDFTYTGTMAAIYEFLKTACKRDITLYGERGTPYETIVKAAQEG